jgi:hypothetical protein
MLSKLRIICLCLAVLLMAGVSGVVTAASPPDSLAAYEASVNRSCQSDADCAVKDVHNCCGYYPACVNRNAATDPERVRNLCAASDMTSICGFPDIKSCACVQGSCQASESSGGGQSPVAQ